MSTVDKATAGRQEDTELLKRVLDGDGTAYRGLVEKYQTRVYAMVYGIVRNSEDARDITQEAFVKAYQNLGKFRLESSFYTWLYRIASNLAIDLTRKQKRQQTTSGFDETIAAKDGDGMVLEQHHVDSPRKVLERKEMYKLILEALDKLPAEQKQIVVLREVEGMSYREISDVMDIPEGTVMSRLYYARKKLQKLLGPYRA
jgi:RNA polymerase sigma-70 factor (ECF subfamily)